MAIPWLVVLQSVPWTEVIKNAPKVAEGARKLWSSIGGKTVEAEKEAPVDDTAQPAGHPALSALQTRLAALETKTAALHEQMLASSELIKALAEQNAQLVRHIETNRRRVAWLSAALVVLLIFLVLRSY